MATDTNHIKNFTDTADSFAPNTHFTYHFKRGECEYKLFLESQAKEILQMMENGVPTLQKLEEVLAHFEREADHIISELLTETTQIRKKLRSQYQLYESALRQQKSKIRKLTEQNINLRTNIQERQKQLNDAVDLLKNKVQQQNQEKDHASKEIEGLQTLLSQYQLQLEAKQTTIDDLKQQCLEQTSLCSQSKSEVLHQARQIEQLKEIVQIFRSRLQEQEALIRLDKNQQMRRMIDHDQMLQDKLNQKNREINALTANQHEQNSKISDLLELIKQLKAELAGQSMAKEREKQNKQKIKAASEKAMLNLKEKYQAKLRKVNDLVRKELKTAQKQVEFLRVSIPKQIGACLKETRGAIFSQLLQLKK